MFQVFPSLKTENKSTKIRVLDIVTYRVPSTLLNDLLTYRGTTEWIPITDSYPF